MNSERYNAAAKISFHQSDATKKCIACPNTTIGFRAHAGTMNFIELYSKMARYFVSCLSFAGCRYLTVIYEDAAYVVSPILEKSDAGRRIDPTTKQGQNFRILIARKVRIHRYRDISSTVRIAEAAAKIHGAIVRILSDFSKLCFAHSRRTFAAVRLLPPFENGMS